MLHAPGESQLEGNWMSNPNQTSFDGWLRKIFSERGVGMDVDKLDSARLLSYSARLFEQSCDLSTNYSPERLEHGFCDLLGPASGLADTLWDETIDWPSRRRCIESMVYVFRDIFSKNPLNETSFMWWDLLRSFEDPRPQHVEQAMLDCLASILSIENPSVWRSALHGLGHLKHKRKPEVIDRFIAAHPELDEDLRRYAHDAKSELLL